MDVYIYVLVFAFFAVINEKPVEVSHFVFGKDQVKLGFSFYAFLLLIVVIASCRYNVGADCLTYYGDFYYLKSGDLTGLQDYELGFVLLCQGLGLFFNDPQCLIIATSLIINLFIAKTIAKLSPQPVLSIFCFLTFYYYFISLNIIRQYVSISIIFLFLPILFSDKKRKYIWFILGCILACQFHFSAIFGLLYLPMLKIKQSSIIKISIVVIVIVAFALSSFLSSYISGWIPRYESYLDYGREGGSDSSVIFLSFFLILSWLYENRLNNLIPHFNFFQNCIAGGLILNIISDANAMFNRMGMIFTINLILFMPLLISGLNTNIRTLAKMALVVLSIAFCIWNLNNNNAAVVPYHFYYIN